MSPAANEMLSNVSTFCEHYERFSVPGSLIEEDTPSLPFLNALFPISLFTIIAAIFQLALMPLGPYLFVSQALAGIVIGPSFIGRTEKLTNQMFSPKINTVLNCFDMLGIVYMSFTISARTDSGIIKNCGKLPFVIGIGSFMIPMMVTGFVGHLLKDVMKLDEQLSRNLQSVALLECATSFHSTFSILTDLKILNSELGRHALSSSLINGYLTLFGIVVLGLTGDTKTSLKHASLFKYMSLISMIAIIVFAFRPLLLWMMRQAPEGQSLKRAHVLVINLMVLFSSLLGEFNGFTAFLGPIILGWITPVSPPMGSCLTDRLEYFVLAVFVPCTMLTIGKKVNLFSLKLHGSFTVVLTILLAIVTKIFSILAASLFNGIPFTDALSLAVLLNSRGLIDLQMFNSANSHKAITLESFVLLVVISILKSAIAIPIVRHFYDSSRRYAAYKRRTIQHLESRSELRILACIHESDDAATIINILEASNHPGSPVGVFVMKLEESIGRRINTPLVTQHRLDKISSSSDYRKVNPMTTAFRHYQERNKKHISLQCFTAVAPYATMHDDICLMAFEKNTSLVIIPFAKINVWRIKHVIKNVLKLSPCSVGILFDRWIFGNPKSIFSYQQTLNVCSIYVGGPDDCEALAYGVRMAEHHNIWFKVFRFIDMNHTSTRYLIEEKHHILGMINDFRTSTIDRNNIEYVEQNITEGAQTIWILNSIGNDFDLILVGRRHKIHSNVLSGLREWCEMDEFGLLGDILVSPDFRGKASVMVIQQQASVVGGMLEDQSRVLLNFED